jgi:hypothetical protein
MTFNSDAPRRFVFQCIVGPAALTFSIEPGQMLTVGRGGAGYPVDVTIPYPAVSRQHIRVRNDGHVCYIQECRTRGGVPILRAADIAELRRKQLTAAVTYPRDWPCQALPQEMCVPLAEGDVVAVLDYQFEVACLPGDSFAGEPNP